MNPTDWRNLFIWQVGLVMTDEHELWGSDGWRDAWWKEEGRCASERSAVSFCHSISQPSIFQSTNYTGGDSVNLIPHYALMRSGWMKRVTHAAQEWMEKGQLKSSSTNNSTDVLIKTCFISVWRWQLKPTQNALTDVSPFAVTDFHPLHCRPDAVLRSPAFEQLSLFPTVYRRAIATRGHLIATANVFQSAKSDVFIAKGITAEAHKKGFTVAFYTGQ